MPPAVGVVAAAADDEFVLAADAAEVRGDGAGDGVAATTGAFGLLGVRVCEKTGQNTGKVW